MGAAAKTAGDVGGSRVRARESIRKDIPPTPNGCVAGPREPVGGGIYIRGAIFGKRGWGRL